MDHTFRTPLGSPVSGRDAPPMGLGEPSAPAVIPLPLQEQEPSLQESVSLAWLIAHS